MNAMKHACLLLLFLLPCLAMANGRTDDLQTILEQQRELKGDIEAGRTDGLTTRQVNMIRKAQDEVFKVAEGKQSLDQLSMDEKVRLENALERINAQVVNTRAASDDQNVCWRERKSGSTVKVTRCGTQEEMREAREGARDFMERPKVCGANCGG